MSATLRKHRGCGVNFANYLYLIPLINDKVATVPRIAQTKQDHYYWEHQR